MIKECLITTGATAKFRELIEAAFTPECLQAFVDNGFTNLNFQCGDLLSSWDEMVPEDVKGLKIEKFGFKKEGLNKEMRACQAKDGVRKKGLIICHAGAGTILDGMRLGVPLIVVPNATLLDNHQDELAEELESQGYATRSETSGLAEAIGKACKKEEKAWGGGHSTDFASIIDEVVGYEDDTRARLD